MVNEAAPLDEKSLAQAVFDYGESKFICSKPLEAASLRRQRAAFYIDATFHEGDVG
jgi:hypothetical protein